MAIEHSCPVCRAHLSSPPEFAGRKVECPRCQTILLTPRQSEIIDAEIIEQSAVAAIPWEIQFLEGLHGPAKVKRAVDPPNASPSPTEMPGSETTSSTAAAASPPAPPGEWMKSMFEALLDPQSIQWLLTLGGGLMVLGGLVWLISQGVLENPLVLAMLFGAASLGVLFGGWYVTLRTRYKVAGRALAFLGCVVTPLNLWFYHVQGLLLLDHGLWIGGVACVLLYVATVWALRDPLFVYAVEAGITLTAVMLLGDFGLAGQATQLCVLLMGLAIVSIHAHLAFPPEGEAFTRTKFGLPAFWCGQLQLAAALVVLAVTQAASLLLEPLGNIFEIPAAGIPLTNSRWVAGCLWLAGAYAYVYSDLVVRRNGVYTYLAAICLVLAEVTLVGLDLWGVEGLIATLAITATAIGLLAKAIPARESRVARAVPPLALTLSVVPVAMGLLLHLRMTSLVASELHLGYAPAHPWMFLAAMLVVAIANRISAFVYQTTSRSLSAVYFFFSAAGLLIAYAALLRGLGREMWIEQAPLLMLAPIGYLIASRLWRGHAPERPLAWVAHAATIAIFAHALIGSLEFLRGGLSPNTHLVLAAILAEAALFYALAATFRGPSSNVYFSVAAACAAVWQCALYLALPAPLFAMIFAVVGLALLVVARALGLQHVPVFERDGDRQTVTRGRGVAVLRAGQGVLTVAILVALVKGVFQLGAVGLDHIELTHIDWIALSLMIVASLAAALLSRGHARRGYLTAAVALAGLAFITLNVAIDISPWRKLQIFLVAVGLVLLAAGYIGRFRQQPEHDTPELVSWALWLGSLLATLPLIVAVFHHWRTAWTFSFYDEAALLTVTMLMLASGVVWRVKASTLLGGATLATYLAVLIVSLVYRPQVAIGIYLAGGGALIFMAGLLLAIYRERLIALPDRIAKREGVFSVIGWR